MAEVMVVMVILSILSAMLIPSFMKYIEKVNEEKYIMEAQGVFRSVEMYIIAKYQGDETDSFELFEQLSAYTTASAKNPLKDYLTVNCTRKARIFGLNIQQGGNVLMLMEYQVDGYLITITRDCEPAIKKLS